MIYAWIGAIFIGLSLGLLGSGGSILIVPVPVYLAGEPSKIAIAESLAKTTAPGARLWGSVPLIWPPRTDTRSDYGSGNSCRRPETALSCAA